MAAKAVLIVDDSAVMRQGLRALFEINGWRVVGEGSNGLEGVQRAFTTGPSLVVMDINMPVMNGLEATKLITDSKPKFRSSSLLLSRMGIRFERR
jgi:YesN/AraC family two-component response regulator